uniref:Glucosylceramidase n=1 Tax=Ciona savignyi TaxID=51511 RepID=H2YFL0_CIOSA
MASTPEWWKGLENKDLKNIDDDEDNNLMQEWLGNSMGHKVPNHGWRIALSHKYKTKLTTWSLPPLTQVPSVLGLAFRYLKYYKDLRSKNKRPCMDFFNQHALKTIYGVPLGGIGGGTINRGWQGDFCKWQLKPGIYTFGSPLADQFIVSIRRHNTTIYQQVLSTKAPTGEPLRSWNWKYCGSYAYYHGLYPRAWTVYDLQGPKVVLTCRQISPVFPHEYKDTSLPTAVFSWDVENNGNEEVEVTIVMSMENGIENDVRDVQSAFSIKALGDNKVSGITMHNTMYKDMPFTLTVGATAKENVTVTHCSSFNPMKEGSEVWAPLLFNGRLKSKPGMFSLHVCEHTACAVAASCIVKPKSMGETLDFSLVWDMPQIHFGDAGKHYRRRYSRWFNGSNAGASIASYALHTYPEWEKKIDDWQNPILDNQQLPDWYKSALFNELYYITDGGTVWLEVDEEIQNSDFLKEYGKFAYLEGQEYKLVWVHVLVLWCGYVCWYIGVGTAVGILVWVSASILHSNPTQRKYLMDGMIAPAKTPNVVPHDVGCPGKGYRDFLVKRGFFFKLDAHGGGQVDDCCKRLGLGVKGVEALFDDGARWKLSMLVTTLACGSGYLRIHQFSKAIVMQESMRHDEDNDGLIENSGAADQTFDGWCVTGPSAYCGGLWLAALRCMEAAAELLGHKEDEVKYHELLVRATQAYQDRLWNGEYFNYDCSPNTNHSTSVMADQCAGQWFLLASGISDVLPDDRVKSALHKVFSLNVEKYHGGSHGAVNGMRPHGVVDNSSVQSNEVWTGVTYALAATMIHKGMLKEGFRTASGIYRSCWQRYGMAFQTPEAVRRNHTFRSLAYMRPLSIWGMQHALENLD